MYIYIHSSQKLGRKLLQRISSLRGCEGWCGRQRLCTRFGSQEFDAQDLFQGLGGPGTFFV